MWFSWGGGIGKGSVVWLGEEGEGVKPNRLGKGDI